MKPEDIPQDVWCIVLSAANSEDMEVAMSDAIMAERERCAKVSEAFGDAIAIAGPSGEFLSIVPYVAEAIRSGLPVEKVKSLLQKGQLAPGKP